MKAHLQLVKGQCGSDDESPAPAVLEQTERQRLLVQTFLPMVGKAASSISRRYRGSVSEAELLGPGTIALHEAAETYEEARHPDFEHYARHHVRGRMLDALRADRFSARAHVERAMERAFERFSSEQTVEVDTVTESDERIHEEMEQGCDDALAAALLAGIIESGSHTPEELLIAREEHARALALLKREVGALPSHHKRVIRGVYEQGKTHEELAQELSAHVTTIQRRHVRALRALRACLVSEGIAGPDPGG